MILSGNTNKDPSPQPA